MAVFYFSQIECYNITNEIPKGVYQYEFTKSNIAH